MKAIKIKIALLLACGLEALSQPAKAEVMIAIIEGYNLGTLSRTVDEDFSAYSTQGQLGFKFFDFNVHGFFQHMDLGYKFNGDAYDGQYSLVGVGLAYSKASGKFGRATLIVQRPMSASFTTLTESAGTVHTKDYKYSELTTLQGGEALQVFGGFELRKLGSGSAKTGENLYLGIFLGYLKQSFATQTTRIKTNNSELAPPSPGTHPVNYSLILKSLNFSVNYDM